MRAYLSLGEQRSCVHCHSHRLRLARWILLGESRSAPPLSTENRVIEAAIDIGRGSSNSFLSEREKKIDLLCVLGKFPSSAKNNNDKNHYRLYKKKKKSKMNRNVQIVRVLM